MPTTIDHLQKHFRLTIKDGLPEVSIETIGEGNWLMCCPLCGCQHQILGVDERQPYIPLCQTHPVLFKAEVTTWRKLNPQVVNYGQLHLTKDVGD